MTEDRLVDTLTGLAAGEENEAETAELRTWASRGQQYESVVEIAKNEALLVKELPKNWQSDPVPQAIQAIGDRWVFSGDSAVLRVPKRVGARGVDFPSQSAPSGFRKN